MTSLQALLRNAFRSPGVLVLDDFGIFCLFFSCASRKKKINRKFLTWLKYIDFTWWDLDKSVSDIKLWFDLCASGSVLGLCVMSTLIGLLFVLRSVSVVKLLCEFETVSDIWLLVIGTVSALGLLNLSLNLPSTFKHLPKRASSSSSYCVVPKISNAGGGGMSLPLIWIGVNSLTLFWIGVSSVTSFWIRCQLCDFILNRCQLCDL